LKTEETILLVKQLAFEFEKSVKQLAFEFEKSVKRLAFEFELPKIESASRRRFAMPFGPNFTALKTSKRRIGMAKRFRVPS
jgi:hypothetical protein